MMNKRHTLLGILLIVGVVALGAFTSNTNLPSPFDEVEVSNSKDTIPLEPRYGDFINDEGSNPFDLNDPSIIKQEVEYDPVSDRYIISERLGEEYYRMPTYLTFEEYLDYRAKKQEENYFRELRGVNSGVNGLDGTDPLSKIDLENSLSDRLFGGSGVDIQVQGNIDMLFGFNYQYVDNPALTIRQRRGGPNFIFNFEQLQMNVNGQIGEKLNFSTNYNTQATFDFDNQMKLEYASDAFSEDDIIKTIEAGNVSLPLQGSLIQGAQNLFGLKTQLQFGHLYITGIVSQQNSEQDFIEIKGGSQVREFEVGADEYDVNRHFFLSHYNRHVFEESLENLPQIRSLFKLQKIEVWKTRDRNSSSNFGGNDRNSRIPSKIVAIADLGEGEELTSALVRPGNAPRDIKNRAMPSNESNNIFTDFLSEDDVDDDAKVVRYLKREGFRQSIDFAKTEAKMLQEGQEYTVNRELGFISLGINVQPYDIIGVAYTYSYNGKIYKVGQLSKDKAANSLSSNPDLLGGGISVGVDTTQVDSTVNDQNVLFVKMLKSTTPNIDKPIWNLMMKNIYNIGAYQMDREDFRLDIFYEDPGKGQRRFLDDTRIGGKPLLQVFNLDQLNSRLDPQRDGAFDFVENLTIFPRTGRVMFPALEPFGSYLRDSIGRSNTAEGDKYAYDELYTETITSAREVPEKNRFTIKGRYRNSSVSNEISLGAFGIPEGSVTVTAGRQLREGTDYIIDYNTGRLTILDDAILASGQTIRVNFENNNLFGLQRKSMLGLRADYKPSDNFNLGATYMHLIERPTTQKVNLGDDAINNKIYGLDVSFTQDAPWLTRLVDKIPLIDTKAPSSINFFAEAAVLKPGHSKALNEGLADEKDEGGVVYLDDFEGSANPFSLTSQPAAWQIASIPQNAAVDVTLRDGTDHRMFKEADIFLDDELTKGVNRARFNWYRIDPVVANPDSSAFYERLYGRQEIFKNRDNGLTQINTMPTFDIAYYPYERGPYNFDRPEGIEGYSEGFNGNQLSEPKTRWGGIMRDLSGSRADFELNNMEYIEMWVLSPFLDDPINSDTIMDPDNPLRREGDLYIDLGNISEDIMPDSRLFYENGLPSANSDRPVANSFWGQVPSGRQIADGFENDEAAREKQDVGLDGLNNAAEEIYFSDWLNEIGGVGNLSSEASGLPDVCNDDFKHYNHPDFGGSPIEDRYKYFNNSQGNSPFVNNNATRSFSGRQRPDTEDLDGDRTLNEAENYFQYRIPIRRKSVNGRMIGMDDNGTGFITDEVPSSDSSRFWYRFKIPLNNTINRKQIGGIEDFRSIRFIRMYMAGFNESVVLRMAELNIVGNQWRRYTRNLTPDDDITAFDLNAVSIERNPGCNPFQYTLPPGIERERSTGIDQIRQNEQSLALTVRNLKQNDSRSIFKNLDLDLRNYSNLKMFVHAAIPEDTDSGCGTLEDDDLSVFIRLGSDFLNNYYEYEIPLTLSDEMAVTCPSNNTAPSLDYQNEVWRTENNFDISLDQLIEAKAAIIRSLQGGGQGDEFSFPESNVLLSSDIQLPEGHRMSIKGRPNLGYVKSVMIGIRNNSNEAQCAEVWINELRVNGLESKQDGGYAGLARMDVQLADFGAISGSTNYSSIGFGAVDARVQERLLHETFTYDANIDLELGKFLPEKSGVQIPFYGAYSNTTITPKYDPYDLDIELSESETDKSQAQEVNTLKSYSFTNVRKQRSSKPKKNGEQRKPKPWDISNFSASYSDAEETKKDPFIKENRVERKEGLLDYSYKTKPKYIKPFEKLPKNEWLKFLRDFNFNPIPNSILFSTELARRFESTSYRFSEDFLPRYQAYVNKQFTWQREYGLTWDLSKSLKVDFDARNYSVIDEFDESSDAFFDGRSYTEEELVTARKDAIVDGLRNLGRTKNYEHEANVNFTVPTKSFPFLDWTTIRAQYAVNYNWNAAPLNLLSIGNVIENGQRRQLTADFNFEQLYNKSDYLKKINRPKRKGKASTPRTRPNTKLKEGGDDDKAKKKKKPEPSTLARAVIRPFMFLRKARFNYSEQFTTIVPGFSPEAKLFGLSEDFSSPGWDFIAGWQPTIRTLETKDYYTDQDWLHTISNAQGDQSWITDEIYLNNEVIQTYTQTMDAKISLEPIPDLRIDLDASRNFTENHSQSFKDRLEDTEGLWTHAAEINSGSLDLTYYSLKTLFQDDISDINRRFGEFEAERNGISERIGNDVVDKYGRVRFHRDSLQRSERYYYGYGRNQQDVLIPAFLAIYAGKDPRLEEVSKNYARDVLFKKIPLPNWRLTYNGLAKLAIFEDVFQQVSISHSYSSKLGVNIFETDLDFLKNPLLLNDDDNFFSKLEVPTISIREGFSPLIALNVETKNNISLRLDITQNRTLSTDFQNGALAEQQSKDITIGFGWLMEEVDIGFLQNMVENVSTQSKKDKPKPGAQQQTPFGGGGGGGGANPGDLNITFDFSVRDDVTFVHLLDSDNTEPTRGSRSLSISPALEYQVHDQLAVRLFVDYSKTIPKVLTSFPITNARGGLVIRFMLQ